MGILERLAEKVSSSYHLNSKKPPGAILGPVVWG